MMIQAAFLRRSFLKLFSGTLLSRLTGFIREVSMAAVFGITPQVAAFWVAYRMSYLLRRLLGEGGLHMLFIPHFQELRQKNPKQADAFFIKLNLLLTVGLFILIAACEMILYGCSSYITSAYSQEILLFTMLLLPALLFITLFALNSAFLNCHHAFFLPSVAPVVVNILWIVAVWYLKQLPHSQAMRQLCLFLVTAFFLQWLITLPALYKKISSYVLKEHPHFLKEIALLLKPFTLLLLGIGATQINTVIDSLCASYINANSPAILWYALRLQQLPLSAVGVGMSTLLLPILSQYQSHQKNFSSFFSWAIQHLIFLLIPLTILLYHISFELIALIYGRGAFDTTAIAHTQSCFQGYILGLLPMSLALTLTSSHYAQKNYKIPVIAALIAMGSNLILNLICLFILRFPAATIAYTTSVSSAIQCTILAFHWKKELKAFFHLKQCLHTAVVTLIAYACIVKLFANFDPLPKSSWDYLTLVILKSGAFTLLFLTIDLITNGLSYQLCNTSLRSVR